MVQKSGPTPTLPDLWSSVFDPVRQFGERVAEFFAPNSDASSNQDSYEINLELPGVDEDAINVEVHDGRLIVSGEKKASQEKSGKDYYFSERVYGRFQRAFQLPEDADQDQIEATYKNGVLKIEVARRAPKQESGRTVKIKSG